MAKKKAERREISSFYYITHIANLPSILKRGILAHQRIEDDGVEFTAIYDREIVGNRKNTTTPAGKSLWEYANAYFQPRNPMLYRVRHAKSARRGTSVRSRATFDSRSTNLPRRQA